MAINLSASLSLALRRHLDDGKPAMIPAGGELLWRWFTDLNSTRAWNMTVPSPITFAEIAAYKAVTGWPIEPRHVAILRELDAAYIDHVVNRSSVPEGVSARPARSEQAMTPQLFDAMFG